MKKQNVALLLSVCLAVGSLAGCGQSAPKEETTTSEAENKTSSEAETKTENDGEETTLRYVGYGDDVTYNTTLEAVDRFKETHPGVNVEVEFTSIGTGEWGDFANKLVSRVGTGDAVDVVGVAIEGTRLLASKGVLTPLNDYLDNDPDGKEMKEDIAPVLFDGFTVDGDIYEVCREWNSMVIVYNTKMFDDAGLDYPSEDWTWEDFLEISQKLTTGEGDNKVWGFANYTGVIQTMPWFITNGASILDDNMENSVLDSPEAIEAMQFVNDLHYKYKVAPVLEAGTDVIQLFAAGRIAMIGGWQGLFPTFQESGFTDYDVQVWPSNKEDATRTIVGMGGIGITATCTQKDLAWDLVKELVSKETIQKAADAGAAIPSRESAGTSETFLSYANNSKIMYEGAYTGMQLPAPQNFPEMEQIFTRYYDSMMSEQMDVTEEMAGLHQELQAAMDAIK